MWGKLKRGWYKMREGITLTRPTFGRIGPGERVKLEILKY